MINRALNSFNSHVKDDGITTRQLANYCARTFTSPITPVSTTTLKGVSSQPTGFTECYRFTPDYSIFNNVRAFGYVIKVADGVNSADFANSIKFASRANFGGFSYPLNYTMTACYGDYVFVMASYN